MAKQVQKTIGDLISSAFENKITQPISFASDGAAYSIPAEVAEAARQGFVGLIAGAGKFSSIELEVSELFGAPECYIDSDDSGYKPLREFLQRTYPEFSEAKDFINQQNKLPVEKRDGSGMNTAEAHINSATRLLNQGIGYLYQAWKARINPPKAAGEPINPNTWIKSDVLPRLAKMAGAKSKLPEAEKRAAQFWLNWLSYGLEHRAEASEILVQHTLGALAGSAPKGKPAPVTKLTPAELAAVNAAIAEKLAALQVQQPVTDTEKADAEKAAAVS
jgi:hypothetical protein